MEKVLATKKKKKYLNDKQLFRAITFNISRMNNMHDREKFIWLLFIAVVIFYKIPSILDDIFVKN